MKKNLLLAAALLLLMPAAFSQNIAINTDASLPNSNAILDVKSSNKGILIPRVTTFARNAIPNTKGLLVYDINTDDFWYNTGWGWQCMFSDHGGGKNGTAWLITGNNNIKDKVNFLGTTNNVPLSFRVNNQPAGRIDSTKGASFFGYKAGASDTAASYGNTAFGHFALRDDNIGVFNTAIGWQALLLNKTGVANTATGNQALTGNTTGGGNTAIGFSALLSNMTGSDNTAVGSASMGNSGTGDHNVGVGSSSLFFCSAGASNTAAGYMSLYFNVSGSENTAYGTQALYSNTAGGLTAVGYQALYNNTIGSNNTSVGYQAMLNNTTGRANTATGDHALTANTTGIFNTAIGSNALQTNTTGQQNTAVGFAAMSFNTTGIDNVGVGSFSLWNNTTGAFNIAIGQGCMFTNMGGGSNTAVGGAAMSRNTSGNGNTAFGSDALGHNITGTVNTAMGTNADVSRSDLTNATAIGAGAIVDASNKVRIGNGAVTVIEGQVPFTTPSDGRFKFNISENVKGLEFILQLRPVTYQFDVKRFDRQMGGMTGTGYGMQAAYDEASRIRRSGFIAQEVEKAADAVGYDFSGLIRPKTEKDHYSLSYDAFVVPLVKAVQEQQEVIRQLTRKIGDQDSRISGLEQQLAEIRKLLPSSK